MNKIKINNNEYNYDYLKDKTLSLKGKGLLSLLIFLAKTQDNGIIDNLEMKNASSDGMDSVRSGLKELEEQHYLTRTFDRDGARITGITYYIELKGG